MMMLLPSLCTHLRKWRATAALTQRLAWYRCEPIFLISSGALQVVSSLSASYARFVDGQIQATDALVTDVASVLAAVDGSKEIWEENSLLCFEARKMGQDTLARFKQVVALEKGLVDPCCSHAYYDWRCIDGEV